LCALFIIVISAEGTQSQLGRTVLIDQVPAPPPRSHELRRLGWEAYEGDGSGIRTSGIVLRMPRPPMAYHGIAVMLSYIAVAVGHYFAGSPGLGVCLRILWEDNMTSYESLPKFIKENWWQAHEYASRNNLLS
jgi:hypothetical protein